MAALGVAWLAALVGGMRRMAAYESTPGAPAIAATQWPADAPVAFAPSKFNLILFVHPRCPCSRATLHELARIMTSSGGRINARVLFVRPPGAAEDWADAPLRQAAAAIPGVTVATDAGGAAASRFAAATSGQALLYAPDGRLAFAGGITALRDHVGDNAGESAILAAAAGAEPAVRRTPVYGCELFSPARPTAPPSKGVPECRP